MAVDAKRGRIFTKYIKEITIASRVGGGNLDGNSRLRAIIAKAKQVNMPADNIKNAIKRGTGELPGVNYEDAIYEGYGPSGVAVLVETTTDNKNRTTSEIRTLFTRNGGTLGSAGSVSWIFSRKGFIAVDRTKIKEDELLGLVLDAGAEDMTASDSTFDITTNTEDFEKVRDVLAKKGIESSVAEVTKIPSTYVKLEGGDAVKMLDLMEVLEDHDDVQNVYANFDISDKIIEEREKNR